MQTNIIAPSYGIVVKCNKKEATIFIPYSANHKLFAPCRGKIESLQFIKGKFKRKIFQANVMKRARLIVNIKGDYSIQMWAEVGKPYRVKRIRVDIKENDVVERGEVIGEILFGSLSEIHFPRDFRIEPKVSMFDKIIGGKTVIAKCYRK